MRRTEPGRARSSYLMAGMALVWGAAFGFVADRATDLGSAASLFMAALGVALLACAGIVLAVSGLRTASGARGALVGALAINALLVAGVIAGTVAAVR